MVGSRAGVTAPVRISVIVPTYGRPAALARCLTSLTAQRFPGEAFEVIVVDDGGDPAADPRLGRDAEGAPRIAVLREPHRGPGAARAAGIRVARGDLLAFLDDDCSVPADYLAQVARAFEAHPDVTVAQVRLENPEPDNLYGVAWKVGLDEALRLNLEPQPDGPAVCAILGGVMVCRRQVFDVVGFDPALPGAREDADLRLQLRKHGILIHYVPEIVVWNHCRRRFRDFVAQHAGYGRGELDLARKWGAASPPARYPQLLAWRSLRGLVETRGLTQGLTVFGLFWVRRHAGRAGMVFEAVAREYPTAPSPRWARFAVRLAGHEGRILMSQMSRRVRGTIGGLARAAVGLRHRPRSTPFR